MKILFVIDSLCKGGKERRLIELSKGLRSKGCEVLILLLTPIVEFPDIENNNLRIDILERQIKKDPFIFFRFHKIVKSFKPDIINVWGMMPAVYAFPSAKLEKIPFVNSMIINAPVRLKRKLRFYSKIVLPFSTRIVANSYAGLNSYNVRGRKTSVIYNGYDFERSENLKEPELIKKELSVKTSLSVCMVAGFKNSKDHTTFICAAKKILNENSDVSFILVGGGETLESMKKLSRGNERIIFTGMRSDVESIVNASDIGVLSTYTEGISNSIVEYMAAGKPVVATDGGGTKEIIIDGESGFLVPVKDAESLYEKMVQLLNDNSLRKTMGEKGRKIILEKFSIENMIEKYYELFNSLIIQEYKEGR